MPLCPLKLDLDPNFLSGELLFQGTITGKINGFPFLEIFGYLKIKNTHKNPKFGRVRQDPIWELCLEFAGWDLSHFAKFGIFMGIF